MGEGGYSVEGGEAWEGSCFVGVEKTYMSGQEGEAGGSDSFQYLRESLE